VKILRYRAKEQKEGKQSKKRNSRRDMEKRNKRIKEQKRERAKTANRRQQKYETYKKMGKEQDGNLKWGGTSACVCLPSFGLGVWCFLFSSFGHTPCGGDWGQGAGLWGRSTLDRQPWRSYIVR
jgi:hypothetical protein